MSRIKTLIVDPEKGMRDGVRRALDGFRVVLSDLDGEFAFSFQEASTGEEASVLLDAGGIDLVLMGVDLRGKGGMSVLAEVAERGDDVAVILIADSASTETAIAATRQGASDFLPKPFTSADLRHAVRRAATGLLLARRARELEAERKQVRFEFIRVLGHELKAPISAVMGYLYLLRDRSLGDDMNAYAPLVERSVLRLDQMTKMIRDLLDMTRMESGKKQRTIESVELIGCIDDALEVGRAEADRRGISVDVHAPETLPMQADRGEIDMVLNNLISNAVKYNRDNGRVDITVGRDGDTVRIAVADTGVGMTPEERDRLFGEFVRIKNEKTRNTLGSGLGLSILKRVVELYDGSIAVESEADVGSTFTVTLKDVSLATEPEEMPT